MFQTEDSTTCDKLDFKLSVPCYTFLVAVPCTRYDHSAVNKPKTTDTVIIARWPHVLHTTFSYSMYSRRHVIGYRRRSSSLLLFRHVRLIITQAIRHLAIATLGVIVRDAF